MTEQERRRAVDAFLGELHDRSVAVHEKGNQMGSAYLAEICGMWSSALGESKNLFEGNDVWLFRWFLNGREDFERATAWLKREKDQAKKDKEAEKLKQKKSLKEKLNVKLW